MCNGIDFVNRIDLILEELCMSRKELGTFIDLGPSTISAWKTRNILPPVETIEKIASKLNVSIEWLLTGSSYQTKDLECGKQVRKAIRDRIYITLASKLGKENADTEENHSLFFTSPSVITYTTLLNWEKGYVNIEISAFEDIANKLGVSLQFLLSGKEDNTQNKEKETIELKNRVDKNIYDTAQRNLNDLFCLDNLTGDRKQAAHIMLNQFMKLENIEYTDKKKKDNQ